jgi:hypothetical protein
MNLQENIQRIQEMMGVIKEKIDIDDDSYVTMNIKNFPKFKKEIAELLKDKLINSNGNFVNFKNLLIKGYDRFKTPILSDDLNINNRYLNYMVSMGSKKFNSLLYSIFSDFYGTEIKSNETKSGIIDCDPSNFEIIGPITAKDEKSLLSYWVNEKGGKVYRIKLPDECTKQLTVDERRVYVSVEPKENRVHFPKGVPERLRGKKLGTLIYLTMIKKLGYITSSMGNSPEIKMVYQDILTNPKYENDVMSLLLQKQVIIFDKNTNLDVKQIFNEFVNGKFTDKKSIKISPALQEILGDDYTNWYNSLEQSPEQSIQDKIEKHKDLEPKGGDTVVDTTNNRIYSFNGEWEYKGKKLIQLSSDKYESLLLPAEEKKRFKVIHRQFN